MNPLEPPDSTHLQAAQGWLDMGHHIEANEELERISGLIERVTFHNEDTGFGVLKVKAKGHRDLVTIVGSLPSANPGEWINAQGGWVRDEHESLATPTGSIGHSQNTEVVTNAFFSTGNSFNEYWTGFSAI